MAYISSTSSFYKQLLASFQPEKSATPPKIPAFFPLVIKVFSVIYSIFQNMRVNLLLIEPGDTLRSENQCAGSRAEWLFFKRSFQLSWRTLEVRNRSFSLLLLFEQQFFSLTSYSKLLSIAPSLGTFLFSFLSPSHSKPESSLEVFVWYLLSAYCVVTGMSVKRMIAIHCMW